jgi:hypothetical protein
MPAVKTWLFDVVVFAFAIHGQLWQGLERLFKMRFKSDRNDAEGSVKIEVRGGDPAVVERAVDALRSNETVFRWMESTIDTIFGWPVRKKFILFHLPGRMIALNKRDLDQEEEDVARVIARRVVYARMLRRRWTVSPCVLLRAQISVLFRDLEAAIAAGNVEEQDWAIDRIRRRIARYQRWAWTRHRKERGERMMERLTTLEGYTPRFR